MKKLLSTFLSLLFGFYSSIIIAQDFVTRWDLSYSGSGATQLSFGVATSDTVNYTWETVPAASSGSGTFSGSTATITGLPANAVIRLHISPANFQRIIINNGPDNNRLTMVENWGSTQWTSMKDAFKGCNYLQITATDIPDLTDVTDMSGMFFTCTLLNSPSNIGLWNTSNVKDLNSMFRGARSFNQPIGNWNTANVTDISWMFFRATAFNQPIGSWNTANVTNMSWMFYFANTFNQPIGSWNTANVTNMSWMFYSANTFNQPIGSWNTAKVTNMRSMFQDAMYFNQPIRYWNTANVKNMSYMFANSYFNQPIGNWNTANVTNMSYMFRSGGFNQPIGNWNTAKVTDMSYMFGGESLFNQPIGAWNTSNVTDMSEMFSSSSFNQPIGSWNTAKVIYMYRMFYVSHFNQSLASWDLSSITNMGYILDESRMDCSNYSATLLGWNANSNTPYIRNLSVGAGGRQYSSQASAARANLRSSKGWYFSDDGLSSGSCRDEVINIILSPALTGTEFCAGANVSVDFIAVGTFASDNQFNILLSDPNGNFNIPQLIGTTENVGSVICTIPSNTIGGEKYRIKVVSTNPVVSGDINNISLKINPENWNLVSPTDNVSSENSIKKAIETINASNTISGLSVVEYNAGKAVNLTPGFQVVSNIESSFKVNISGCN